MTDARTKRWLTVALAAAALLGGCRRGGSTTGAPHPRLITFSPALTAIAFELGLGDHVVGVTSYCNLPAGTERPVAGDLQTIDAERILSLRPDMILLQQDPAGFQRVRELAPDVRMEHFTIETLPDIAAAVERVGTLVRGEEFGKAKRQAFEDRLARVGRRVAGLARPKVLFLTRFAPPAVAGRDSFLHEMIELAGGEDVTADYRRWTQIDVERILAARPEVVVCLGEEGQADEIVSYIKGLDIPAARSGRIHVVTDPGWTIPSTRLAELAERLAKMIHPTGGQKETKE